MDSKITIRSDRKEDYTFQYKGEDVTLKADEAVLDKNSQTIKLSNNVKIIKDGSEISGEYLLVNLNEQNILMDNPSLDVYQFNIKAQQA